MSLSKPPWPAETQWFSDTAEEIKRIFENISQKFGIIENYQGVLMYGLALLLLLRHLHQKQLHTAFIDDFLHDEFEVDDGSIYLLYYDASAVETDALLVFFDQGKLHLVTRKVSHNSTFAVDVTTFEAKDRLLSFMKHVNYKATVCTKDNITKDIVLTLQEISKRQLHGVDTHRMFWEIHTYILEYLKNLQS